VNGREPGEPIDPAHELPAEPASTELGGLAEELRRAVEERDQLQDKWLRALADLDNFRKRAARDLSDARGFAAAEAVRPFLTVVDGFERALAHTAGGNGGELRTGIERLHRQLLEALRQAGVEAIEAEGRPFDPHLHEAIEVSDTEAEPEGTVLAELQRGYRLRERLLRPAMVRVARRKA
jgi:molecular chaperone GrpE